MAWLDALAPDDRRDVLAVLDPITRGQKLDLQRFGDAGTAHIQRLTANELDEYTYLVAGCVGEFWTRLGFRHVDAFASLPQHEMLELGRRYGMALQLINVLRDARDDERQGRGYLPDSDDVGRWMVKARDGLRCGMTYALSIGDARVRTATALPALIGARTLALMEQAGASHVKVPRSEIRWLLARVALSMGSRARLQREFDIALRDNRAR